jgi:hypothetical protein
MRHQQKLSMMPNFGKWPFFTRIVAIPHHAEARLTNFLLNGGFQQRLLDRMTAHHQAFAQAIGSPAAPKRSTRGLGFGPAKSTGPTIDVDLVGGNRDA